MEVVGEIHCGFYTKTGLPQKKSGKESGASCRGIPGEARESSRAHPTALVSHNARRFDKLKALSLSKGGCRKQTPLRKQNDAQSGRIQGGLAITEACDGFIKRVVRGQKTEDRD